jgi:hypothetical protein
MHSSTLRPRPIDQRNSAVQGPIALVRTSSPTEQAPTWLRPGAKPGSSCPGARLGWGWERNSRIWERAGSVHRPTPTFNCRVDRIELQAPEGDDTVRCVYATDRG